MIFSVECCLLDNCNESLKTWLISLILCVFGGGGSYISVTRVINYIQTADDDDNDNEHFLYICIGYFVIILRR